MPPHGASPAQRQEQVPAHGTSPPRRDQGPPTYQPAPYGMQHQSPAQRPSEPAGVRHPSPMNQPRQFQPSAGGGVPPLQPELPAGAETAGSQRLLPKKEGPSDAKEGAETKTTTTEEPQSRQSKEKEGKAAPPPDDGSFESADSALPMMLAHLFTILLGMAWFAVKVPVRIGFAVVMFWAVVIALRVAWFFLADDGGAWEMGAGVDWDRNMPGIY